MVDGKEEVTAIWGFFTKPAVPPVSTLVLLSLFAEEALSALRSVVLDILEIRWLLLLSSDVFLSNAVLLDEEESFFPNTEEVLADVTPFWMLVLRCPKGTLAELRVAMVGSNSTTDERSVSVCWSLHVCLCFGES